MQNYFNRKNIRPAIFFHHFPYQDLKDIWEKFHHKITSTNDFITNSNKGSMNNLLNTVGNLSSLNQIPEIQTKIPMRKSQTNFSNLMKSPLRTQISTQIDVAIEIRTLDVKIFHLQSELKNKDNIIRKLREEIQTLKEE